MLLCKQPTQQINLPTIRKPFIEYTQLTNREVSTHRRIVSKVVVLLCMEVLENAHLSPNKFGLRKRTIAWVAAYVKKVELKAK